MTAGAVIGRAGAEIGCEFIRRRQRPPDEAKGEINRKIGEVRLGEFRDQRTGQNQTRHGPHRLYASKTGAKNVGNSTSSAPARVETQIIRPKPDKTHASVGSSSPSVSRSGEPARICSAIRPEFWRIAASIFAVMSGLVLRNALAFSRPWPRRWLS